MTPQELKNSILQLAIQGKLVEQRPEEGTAEELYNAIVFSGRKDSQDVSTEEIPFDIPSSWKWVRHNNLFEIVGGSQPPKSKFIDSPREGYVRLYQIRDYGEKPVPVYVPVDMVSKFSHKGEILLARYGGSLGKIFWAEEGAYNVAMAKVVPLYSGSPIDSNYLFYYYNAPLYQTLVKGNTRSAQAGFNKEDLNNLLFPLPPLAEQKRIVAKIEELLPLIERYEKAWTRLEDFNKRFPGDMQKSILQMAIQGKLVEQRPEEGTGVELYKQIQAEKQALIKVGKIKKDRRTDALGTPQDEEIPFDIPESWEWVYLGSILNKLTDGTHRTPKYSTSGVKFVSVKDMSSGVLSLDNTKFITKLEHEELFTRCDPVKGDMLLSKVGTTGVPAIVDTDEPFSLFVSVALLKYSHNCINKFFLYYLLKSPLVQLQAADNTRGVGNKNWVLDAIANTIVVLPPLAEQKRIVARLEELLPLCEKLK